MSQQFAALSYCFVAHKGFLALPHKFKARIIRQFLGLEGNIGQMLGLSNDFAVKMIKAVGNYGEIYERHFDSNLMPRGANALSDDFGLQLSLPTTSIVVNQAIAPITVNEDATNTVIDF